ncbi:glycosyltransferase [Endozoicomonas sp. SCSIO W0465]|uniref:glycosyltransferase n=1 Tax=Endozoicomonas sp. SCSIO W0465 TaxID=2918516 RepID=UPI0020757818|nr:glycosyltransferase [Endozoicomonas sp. SCSIO W0465]USE39419.1 glycosyltransferase [Endozoicomonas sp. SCSIO W0465]
MLTRSRVLRVAHIISGLNDGGAEGALYRLLTAESLHQHVVISLTDRGKYADFIESLGVQVICLNMKNGALSFKGVFQLYSMLKNEKPDVVQTWMYHADLVGGMLARLAGIRNVYWGVRHSDFGSDKRISKTFAVAKLCALISPWAPRKIICCAQRAVDSHLDIGYTNNFLVIPNGYVAKSEVEGDSFRRELVEKFGFAKDSPLVGMVARYNTQKDHTGLIKAISLLQDKLVDFNCVLIGPGVDSSNTELMELISSCNLQHRVKLLGARADIPSVMAGLDLHVLSSSHGEAFPNVVAEAMLYGTPCVVTDVGDASMIVGDYGWVVAPGNPVVLADSIESALSEFNENAQVWNERCQLSCKRITDHYGLNKMARNFCDVWEN